MVLGEAVSPEVLQQLGIEGKRAAVAFFCRDNGHECGQELRDFESKATRYRTEFNCDIVAIRSRGSWIDEETPAKFPSLRFFVDEDEEHRTIHTLPHTNETDEARWQEGVIQAR